MCQHHPKEMCSCSNLGNFEINRYAVLRRGRNAGLRLYGPQNFLGFLMSHFWGILMAIKQLQWHQQILTGRHSISSLDSVDKSLQRVKSRGLSNHEISSEPIPKLLVKFLMGKFPFHDVMKQPEMTKPTPKSPFPLKQRSDDCTGCIKSPSIICPHQ